MSVNRELNSMEKRRDTILDDDNENAIKLNDEDRNTITKNKSKDKLLKKTWVVCLLAMVCCFLWGSAFPCIKTGYRICLTNIICGYKICISRYFSNCN